MYTINGMRIVGLIPARGGSKGIPRKNLIPISGTPLVAHKIKQAFASLCNEVWVSSDSSEIHTVSRSFGAQIIYRPDELATDESSTDEVINHAVEVLKLKTSDIVVLLQPTSPLIKVKSINNCIEKLLTNKNFDCVLAVRGTNVFSWITINDGEWIPDGHDRYRRKRRQELPESGWETGGCYALRVKEKGQKTSYHQSPTGVVKISHVEALDIDDIEDLNTASTILNFLEEI